MRLDWVSRVAAGDDGVGLLASPKLAMRLARGGFGAHLLDRKSISMIEREEFPQGDSVVREVRDL